jgi:hypothetical protein
MIINGLKSTVCSESQMDGNKELNNGLISKDIASMPIQIFNSWPKLLVNR